MRVVVWSVDCEDWKQHPEDMIAGRAAEAATPGAILLLHDSLAEDPAVAEPEPVILDRARVADLVVSGLGARGLKAVSVWDLLGRAPHRTAWFRP